MARTKTSTRKSPALPAPRATKASAKSESEPTARRASSGRAAATSKKPTPARSIRVSRAPTAHLLGPEPDDFFAVPLAPSLSQRVIPLLCLDGRALGLPVAAIPIVYHETFTLPGPLEIEPREGRFVLHVPKSRRFVEIDGAEDTRKRLRKAGHVTLDPGAKGRRVGHVGGKARWVQMHKESASGVFVAQVDCVHLGLADISFYVFWDAQTNRFHQAQQFT